MEKLIILRMNTRELTILDAPSLDKKGVKKVAYFKYKAEFKSLSDVWRHVKFLGEIIRHELGVDYREIVFMDNEDIGSVYILYRFRYLTEDGYIGCRVVTKHNQHLFTVLTIGE